MKEEVDISTIILADINTSLSIMDRKTNISKEIGDLKNTINKLDQIDIYRTLCPTAEYTVFSSVHRSFSRIDTKKWEHLCTADGNPNGIATVENSIAVT